MPKRSTRRCSVARALCKARHLILVEVPNDQKYGGRAQGMYFFSHWTNRMEADIKLGALLMGSKPIETDSTWRSQPRHLQFSIVIVCLGGRRFTRSTRITMVSFWTTALFPSSLVLSLSRFQESYFRPDSQSSRPERAPFSIIFQLRGF